MAKIRVSRKDKEIIRLTEAEIVLYYNDQTGEVEAPTSKTFHTFDAGRVMNLVQRGWLYVARYTKDARLVLRVSKDYYAAIA